MNMDAARKQGAAMGLVTANLRMVEPTRAEVLEEKTACLSVLAAAQRGTLALDGKAISVDDQLNAAARLFIALEAEKALDSH